MAEEQRITLGPPALGEHPDAPLLIAVLDAIRGPSGARSALRPTRPQRADTAENHPAWEQVSEQTDRLEAAQRLAIEHVATTPDGLRTKAGMLTMILGFRMPDMLNDTLGWSFARDVAGFVDDPALDTALSPSAGRWRG